ncbi:42896_t:CDS:1, partial [Gigaspora margarita]
MTISKFRNETPESIVKKLERKPKKQRQLSFPIIKMTFNKNRKVKRTKSLPCTSEDLETFFSNHVEETIFLNNYVEEPLFLNNYVDTTFFNGNHGSLFDERNLNSDYTI